MPAQQALLAPPRPAYDPLTSDDLYRDMHLGGSDQIDDLAALRLVRVPDVGPPFDGELKAGAIAAETARHGRADEPGAAAAPADPATSSAASGQPESPGEWPRQFARLLAEALAGARPVRQILPWTSERARGHLHRLMPLFGGGQRPRVMRVIATRPAREVIEMTVILSVGTRTRALAIRLEHMSPRRHVSWHAEHDSWHAEHDSRHAENGATTVRQGPAAPTAPRWVCTDIEAA